MDLMHIVGFILAAALAVDAPLSARMFKTGELSEVGRTRPLITLLYVVAHGLAFFSAIFYFSWAYLNWQHVGAFFLCYFAVGEWLVGIKSKVVAWSIMCVCTLMALTTEALLLFPDLLYVVADFHFEW